MSEQTESQIILIVDDNPTNLEVLSQMLLHNGFEIAVATDGESALEQIAYHQPELILLDIMMPKIDGFQICRCLKEDPITRDIPVIFMTALSDTESKVKGLSMGAVDYVTKPFQYEEVLARVRVHLELRLLTRRVLEQTMALQKVNQELQRLANIDGLTEVANRRYFNRYLEQRWKLAIKRKQPISLLLCDIDYFKQYNDCYGHHAGDECLKQIAKLLVSGIRDLSALVARYGGEEFAVILPNTTLEASMQIAESIRTDIWRSRIPHVQSEVASCVTLSIGIGCQIPTLELPPVSLITTADKALYAAKERGRNNCWSLSLEKWQTTS